MNFRNYQVPYQNNEQYAKKVAYFSMEFAIHQPLKIYSGGLGFLAGSHLRSAYELRQNLIGVGILWKNGYYDQARNQDQTLQVTFMEKNFDFLEDTGIKFQILIHEHPVWVKAYYLNPETFCSAPLFLLSTDLPENDYVSQTITHRLYDANVATKVAQFILLGVGGAMDLAAGAKKLIIIMTHTNSDGSSKIVPECTLPLTAYNVVDLIITELAVFNYNKGKLTLIELMPGATLEVVREKTDAKFTLQ